MPRVDFGPRRMTFPFGYLGLDRVDLVAYSIGTAIALYPLGRRAFPHCSMQDRRHVPYTVPSSGSCP